MNVQLPRRRFDVADYDLIILGAGPGGYVAAIRAAQLGLNTAIIEKEEVGGVCLNWGCIPSKALLKNADVLNLFKKSDQFGITFDNMSVDYSKAIERSRQVVSKLTQGVKFLLKKNKVDHIDGTAVFLDPNSIKIEETEQIISANNIIIATGAKQRELPNLPIDHQIVITSRDALELSTIPENIGIIGGGATGVEFAHIYSSYGSEVTLIELMDHLVPNEDEEISETLEKSFSERGIKIHTSTNVNKIISEKNQAVISIEKDNVETNLTFEKILICVGTQGNTENLGLEDLGLETSNSFIKCDETLKTNIPNIYAIGDVTGQMALAHVASAQAILAVETIAGINSKKLNYETIPKAIYCEPQIASFGLTEKQALNQNINFKVGKFPISASGKALALGNPEGLIKIISEDKFGEIIGVHLIGSEVTELISELSMTKLLEGTIDEIGWMIHPHPTISETIKESALDSFNEAIHI
ncbi:MAG: dihydrolipoyl dehydrogenase [Chloroflexi bacterium]|nr:dihydrolipoyl dehydrogenase [Chloroflexota bacterium]